MAHSSRVGLMYVVTSSLSVRLLQGQPRFFHDAGFEVTVVCSPGSELNAVKSARGMPIFMTREISVISDLKSLWSLWTVMRQLRPAITNVQTPKAGLLGGLAAFLARVPCRIYTLQGLRLETTTGLKRSILALTERIACFCAHRVICVSESLRQKVVELGLVERERTVVFAPGSGNGVDALRFNTHLGPGSRLREKLRIPQGAPVVGFVGRLTRDKGITELAEAFALLRGKFSELRLLIVGDLEDGDPLSPELTRLIKNDPNIICTGFVEDAAAYYGAMNILALPSYREGFPNVVLEAQAAGKPAVVTNATGAIDSVLDGVTGFIVPIRDSGALAAALARLLSDVSLATVMGENGRKRVMVEFQPARLWHAHLSLYRSLLEEQGLQSQRGSNLVPEEGQSGEASLVTTCTDSRNA